MEIKSQTNTFNGGLDMDTDVSYVSNDTYRYAENIRIVTDTNGTNGILQNIQYIKEYINIDALSNQKIIQVTVGRIPDETHGLVNTAILLTKEDETGYNNIYLVNNFNSQQLSCKKILSLLAKIDVHDDISMIYNYETSLVYKLYINIPDKGLMIINLADYTTETTELIENVDQFYSNPTAVMPPLELAGYTNGNLTVGAYQYFYKLYTNSGIESSLSAGSQLIYLGKPNITSSIESEGYDEDFSSSYGINLTLTISNSNFDKIRLYRVFWHDNNDSPTISIVLEDSIQKGNQIVRNITDGYSAVISTVTEEEFNDIIPFTFYARIMQQLNNRLFFANIQTNDWDIPDDYDCRAYRANHDGNINLQTSDGNTANQINCLLSDVLEGTIAIDKEHDAINPMNSKLVYPDVYNSEEYAYRSDGSVYGGEGINISFTIVYGELTECNINNNSITNRLSANTDETSSSMSIFGIKNDVAHDSIQFGSDQLLSYSNPYIASKFASYQRDESYRFGIVFYNERGVASPVHWICDVRFPSGDTTGCEAFTFSKSSSGGVDTNASASVSLIARPFGIEFEIKNFPEGAVAAEIVRCDRTITDRSILAQGMINNPVYFYDQGMNRLNSDINYDQSNGINDIRCPFIPTMAEWVQTRVSGIDTTPSGVGAQHWNTTHGGSNFDSNKWYKCHQVKLFASPEVSMNRSVDFMDTSCKIVPVCVLRAVDNTIGSGIDINTYFNKYGIEDAYYNEHLSGNIAKVLTGLGSQGNFNTATEAYAILTTGSQGDNYGDGLLIRYFDSESAKQFLKNKKGQIDFNDNESINKYYVSDISQLKLARTDLPTQNNDGIKSFKGTYVDTIGGLSYTNNAVASGVFSIAGINGLMSTQNIDAENIIYNGYSDLASQKYTKSSLDGTWTGGDLSVRTILCNIKKNVIPYGGISYLSRAANTYISCGGYMSKNTPKKVIFGGDVFLTLFNYQNATQFTLNDYTESGELYHKFCQVYIPIESTINTYMRNDDYYAQQIPNNKEDLVEQVDKDRFYIQTNPGVINSHAQTKNAYQYNSAYSVSSSGVNYAATSTNDNIGQQEYNIYQIVCSEPKSAGEQIDSWQNSKFANTLDLDSDNGHISQMVQFNGRLYVLQQNALSVLSINERSLISDNSGSALVLGTGGILDRYDVVVKNYGTNTINDKSVISTFQSIYWYDNNKNVICSYGNNGFHVLSKEKKVQTFLNKFAQVDNANVISVVNDKWNEVWMKFNSKVLVYNEHANIFTSFYTHCPDYGLRFYDRLVTIKNKRFYYTNTFGEEDIVKKLTCKLSFIINQDPQYTKVFDNQWLPGNIEDPNNVDPQVISNVSFQTKSQNSFNVDYNNIDYREDTYRFPIPREDRGDLGSSDEQQQNLINRSYLPRMRGKYIKCNYTFNCDNDKSFEIPFIKTTYRYSML